ncbi:ABC transporter permease [Maribacter halichondriae]|uniref:ABC transporter permease n=1 Tax=Maribacter halichondriae TaxID=2980554 RepID=UPI002358D03C|nr:ABC transporter permease [Maribacter sp. Hal144]
MEADYPEVKKAGKIYGSALSSGGKRAFRLTGETQNNFEEGFLYGDQKLFEILEINLEQGNSEEALTRPGSIVISESRSAKYFPNGNALGETLVLDDNPSRPYTVTGVMTDFPDNSHLDFDFLLPIEDTNMSWTSQNYFTYVLLDERSDIDELQKKMASIIENYVIPAQIQRGRDAAFIDVLKTIEYRLQPIGDIHLKSDIEMADGLEHGDIRFVWLFAAIAGFILLLAGINFINLSTAKSANRAKEVGLRKTVGAFKSNLVAQFLTESVLYSLISFVLGAILAWGLLPTFNSIAAKTIAMPWTSWWFLPILLVSGLIIGVIAGLYPAFYLSAFRPVNVLKGSIGKGAKSGRLRSGLVVFQFSTSVVLIIGTLIIYKQMDFILKKELGYDKEQVVILEGTNVLGNKAESFKNQLVELPQVQQVSLGDYLPIKGSKRNQTTFKKVSEGSENPGVLSQTWRVDYDYVKTLGIKVKEGRDFSKQFASDSINSIIINQKMAHDLNLEKPLGKQLDNNNQHWTIVGVVENFHFASLKEDISPVALTIGNDLGTVAVKISSGNVNEALASITSIWNRNVSNQAISYSFLDQRFVQMHEDVQRMGKIFNSFALFAILVACLGLFALSAFMVEQRKKEISIRIVLGAPFRSIYKLLTLDFMKLIFVSIAISVPIGWCLMNRWLEDFAYRIDIGWEVFLGAGGIALFIALLTISYRSIGAALMQPLKSLRTE